jgi:enoyl-CoA hydratase
MPETGIGLFPDVGGGWYLSRLEGRLGQFLALTGARLDGAECRELGIATHYLPHEHLEAAKLRIAEHPDRTAGILGELSVTPPEARIMGNIDKINRHFASDRYEDILASLEADEHDWAQTERDTLGTKSPQTCKVALRQLAEGAVFTDFAEEMRNEYRIGSRVLMLHDFIEGVRAVIVDKDNAPQWQPATPEGVGEAWIDAIFAPLPAGEEWEPLA